MRDCKQIALYVHTCQEMCVLVFYLFLVVTRERVKEKERGRGSERSERA